MEYLAYDEYQSSRLEWLDAIPVSWDVTRLRLLSNRYSGGTPSKDNPAYWQDGTIPWLNSGSVNQGTITKPSTFITELGFRESSAKWIPEESIIIALAGQGKTKGTAAFTTFKTTCNQSMGVVVFEKDYSRFMYWWLVSQYKNIRGMASDDARDGLNLEMIGTIPCPLPSLSEQQKIAAFLDYKTQQIDQLIEKKKALIEKLEEKRIAVITQAVTKGLDKNAKLKPSGVDWLGDVPEHWEVSAIKRNTGVSRGASPRPIQDTKYFDTDGEYAWVRIADVSANNHYLEHTTEKLSELGKSLSVPLEPGMLFLSIAGTVGKPMITNIKCCIHDGFVYFPYLSINPEFLYYIFMTGKPYLGLGKLGTQLNLNTDTVGGIKIGLPLAVEQSKIIAFLEKFMLEMDAMINKVSEAKEKLQEYRSAIITSAVTGKIDIRDIEIPKEVA